MKNKLKELLQKYAIDTKKVLVLIAIFVLLKSLVYISPLILGQITSLVAFGEFEYTFNIGLALVGILSFGLPGAYAYFVLKGKKVELIPVFHLHFIVLTILLLLAVLIHSDLLNNLFFGSLIIGVTMADQILVASILKSEGRNNLSVVVDTGVYIVLTIIVVVCFMDVATFNLRMWFTSVLIYQVLFSFVCHAKYLRHLVMFNRVNISVVYRFGVLILVASPLFVLISSSTRLYIEHYTGLTGVGYYSFYFRLGSVLLIFYRVLGILLFRRLFLEAHDKLDKLFKVIIGSLVIIALAIFILLKTPLSGLVIKESSIFYSYSYLLPFCLFQIIFWINAAFFESIMVRENLIKKFILLLILSLFLLLLLLVTYDFYFGHSLRSIIVINTSILFLLFLGQHYLLKKKGIYYRHTTRVHLGVGVIYTVFVLLN